KMRLTASPLIKRVEFIPEYELASGELPNDYYTPNMNLVNDSIPDPYNNVQDTVRNSYLDLIKAPCAWEITAEFEHGDPNVLVGVSDSKVMPNHEELLGKFDTIFYNVSGGHYHGTGVAGLIAGNTNNGKGTASIGWNTKMVASGTGYKNIRDLAIWSHNNNDRLRAINMSWGNRYYKNATDSTETVSYQIEHRDILRRMYKCISEKYNIVLVAAGHNKVANESNHPNDWYSFPAYWESVIAVTSVGHIKPYQDYDYTVSTDDTLSVKDVLWWSGHKSGNRHWRTHILNNHIDIAAPGYHMYRPTVDGNSTNSYIGGGATSAAAPIVSGAAALMLVVNPDLTSVQVKDILKFSADRIDTIPHNQEFFGQGEDKLSIELGRLNAYKAVKMAKYFDEYGFDIDSMPKKIDLMIRDNEEDIGEEPNETTEIFWNSPDIWVRNQPDGEEGYENVEYDPNEPNYVYVRVKNVGCDPSSEEDELKLYWTKAASSMSWPEDYMGANYFPNGALKGDTVATVNIPSIKPGEETILEVPWSNVPNPDDYESNDQPWHFCLLARIESDDDPITTQETSSIHYNDKHNNNIASKNLTVVNLNDENLGQPIGGSFSFPNPLKTRGYFDLQLKPDDAETGRAIFNEAEVWVTLDEDLIVAWEAGGKQSTDLVHRRDGLFLVTGENAAIENIKLDPGEFGLVQLQFNFLAKEITEKETYLYHAIQRNSANNNIMGGESYQINKSPRPLFSAITSGNKTIDKEEEVILNAELIGEPANYNWYDNEGNLIYEGADFSTSAEIGKQYKLEVVTLSDGYKDYAEVELTYKPNRITSLSPNPTTGQVEVEYKINEGESAYLAITSIENPNISNNYILDMEESAFDLNVDNLSAGIYAVALIVNGQIVDTKNLIKN
ncbi:MAG TPA: S8/S53 family peptidase, partial [Flavobacteriaceae bacterium]|nr:S8/S53 family peptidase [Flavobacteriaceae bacterium]